jgi:hypothetical protein
MKNVIYVRKKKQKMLMAQRHAHAVSIMVNIFE